MTFYGHKMTFYGLEMTFYGSDICVRSHMKVASQSEDGWGGSGGKAELELTWQLISIQRTAHTHVKPGSLYLSTAHMHVLHAAYI